MRLIVDLNRCQGFAQCVFLAPDVFELRGDEILISTPTRMMRSGCGSCERRRPAQSRRSVLDKLDEPDAGKTA